MKRKSSPQNQNERRKSARLEQDTPTSSHSPNLIFQELESPWIDVGGSCNVPRLYRDMHNRFLPFAQNHTSKSHQRAVLSHNAAAAETCTEIVETIRAYSKKLEEQFEKLEKQAGGFVHATLELPEMYQHGDLLSLTLDELFILPRHMNVEHKDRFADCVSKIIDHSMMQEPTADEQKQLRADTNSQHMYLQKVFILIQILLDLDLQVEAMHALVLLKSLYHQHSPRVAHPKVRVIAHPRIEMVVRCLVDEAEIPDKAREKCDLERHLQRPAKHGDKISIAGLTWCSSLSHVPEKFWNFASAATVLRTAYLGHRHCENNTGASQFSRTCYDEDDLVFLGWLDQKAWIEIRAKTLDAIGPILPAELTDNVFQHALASEGMSLDVSLTRPVLEQAPEWKIEECRAAGLEPPKPRLVLRTKREYDCPRLRAMDDLNTIHIWN